MKKLILSMVAFISFSSLVNAQDPATLQNDIKTLDKQESALKKEKKEKKKELRKMNGQEVNYQAKENFISDFPKIADVKWMRKDYFDEASFTKDGKATIAYYGHDGKLVGTTSIATFADLPANAQKHINEKYKDYIKGSVIFFDDNEFNDMDMLLYGLQFDDEDNYFVELMKNNTKMILRVRPDGDVFYFTTLK